METPQRTSLCRWAAPTLFLPWPVWLDAWSCPWSCVVDETPRPLISTEVCRTCPRWEARPHEPGGFDADAVARRS